MSHNYTPQCESLYINLRRTKKTLCVFAESNRALAESNRALAESNRRLLEENEAKDEIISVLEESNRSLLEENEAKDETIKDQQQEIADLRYERDCQPNYCENDGSSNCIMSRSRICSR
jgi:vacuolar-type H+-ATPase subunit I/STV1